MKRFLKRLLGFLDRKINWYGELDRITNYQVHPTVLIYDRRNVILCQDCTIAEYVIIRSPTAPLVVGENTQVGPFVVIHTGHYGVTIGTNVMIAPHCVIAGGNHEYRNLDIPMINSGDFSNGPIVIEDDVWIGANCTITDNVRIGKGAIVGANSLVNRNVDPYSIVGGVPASIISTRLKYKSD